MQAGLLQVRNFSFLWAAARDFAAFMGRTGRFDHDADDGRKPADRVVAKGYRYCMVAENIAYAHDSRVQLFGKPLTPGQRC